MKQSKSRQEEEVLLSSIGLTVANADKYESSVLKEASLSLAPTLTGVGFPDLAPLAPSYDERKGELVGDGSNGTSGSADAQHVATLLTRVKRQLSAAMSNNETHGDSQQNMTVLRLKEQMLLVYLQKVAGLSPQDLPVDALREAASEAQQSRQLLTASTGSTATSASAASIQTPHDDRTCTMPPSSSSSLKKSDGSIARPVSSNSASASFGKQALLQKQRPFKRKRVQTAVAAAAVASRNPEDEELKEMLRQSRRERQERKQRRKQQWNEHSSNSSDDDDEEVEMTLDDEVVPEVASKAATAPTESSITVVTCPLCQGEVNGGDTQEESDKLLSLHMQQCQEQQGHGRRRTRARTRSTSTICTTITNEDAAARKQVSMATDTTGAKKQQATKSSSKKRTTKKQPVPRWKEAVDDYYEEDYEDRVDDWIDHGRERMQDLSERDETEIPPGPVEYSGGLVIQAWVNNRLFPYQRAGLGWMWDLHQQEAGGIVGDEMGLGKTVQVSAYLGAMAASRKLDSILIVGPATMLQHWLTELSIWAPGLRRILIHKSGESDGESRSISPTMLRSLSKWLRSVRANRLNEAIDEEDFELYDEDTFCGTGYAVVTTYESIRRSPDIWTRHNWSYVVLDEGQKIRNPDADVTIACKRMLTPNRLLLSGTPIQNDLRELWSLFDFVFPGRLGTLPAFESEFADPIKRGGFSNASPMTVRLAYHSALMLRDLIDPYLLRRQKKDIKEVSRMPGKTEQVLFCRLSNRQRAMYEAFIRSDLVMSILRGSSQSSQLLGAVTTLRKICNHPDLVCGPDKASFESFARNGFAADDSLVGESSDEYEHDMIISESIVERSGKLQVLAKILPLWKEQGHRVLIFCQWRKMLDIIQRFTDLQGWKFARLDGNTNVASRQRLVDAFNTDESYFGMLMTTRTGGVGLNLTGADRIILYDPDWNPQTDAQARERAWRFGQKNAVTVYRLITAGTIEEKIYHRQIFKTALTNKILQDPRQRRLFSQRDLKDFFTLKSDVGSVASGGHGLTETGEITKGSGVVDPDEAGEANVTDNEMSSEHDNVTTLQEVLKSKGIAGVFDHDVVDYGKAKKSSSVREMEERAKIVARNAAKALKESAVGMNRFEPTWTGSLETESRFGGGGASRRHPSDGRGGTGSNSLLESLKRRNDPSRAANDGEASQYADLLKRIKLFVKRRGGERNGSGPTTDELLSEFKAVPNVDAAIFRRLLNTIATVERGRWRLKC